jgi:NAD(P)-dependent dehydrogenase (short-subunit alcohol dehydrogenase family)
MGTVKNAVITGAAGNLGLGLVQEFLSQGYRVIATVIHQRELSRLPDHPMLEAVVLDLRDEAAVQQKVTEWVSQYGHIHAAVFTTGGFVQGDIRSTQPLQLQEQFELNVLTVYTIARPLFLQMMESGNGHLFFIGARPGLSAHQGKGLLAYSLSKSLVFRLAEHFNEEAKGTAVITSVVVPSVIDTPQNRAAMPDASFDQWVKPAQIASVIAFYCSEAGAPLREPVIKVYGGS